MTAQLHPEGGSGPDLVLIHGFGADRLGWGATVPAFVATHRVWTVDLPGHGLAGHGLAGHGIADGAATDPDGMTDAVQAALAPLPGPVALVGHSLGGAIAAILASRDPARFPRPVLIAPGGLGLTLDAEFLTGFATLDTPDQALAHLRRLVVRDRLIAPAMAAHVLAGLGQPGRRAALADIARKLLAAPPPPCPDDAQVIWGEGDRINPHDPARAALWGDRFALLPGTGHLPQVEAAAKVNRLISAALTPA